MKCHQNKQFFNEIVKVVAEDTGLDASIIEKDYFVSLLLRSIQSFFPDIIFKGGTSLSKCYHLINRFSEDIDINFKSTIPNSGSNKKKLKQSIVDAAYEVEMVLENEDEIKSGLDFNRYKFSYPNRINEESFPRIIFVETYVRLKSFPSHAMEVTNYISDYLIKTHDTATLDKYELRPFTIQVQSIERTFVDKIFALCDYSEVKKYDRNSRHLYDLYMIYRHSDLDRDIISPLFQQVAEERSKSGRAVSSANGYRLSDAVRRIVDENKFKFDYETAKTTQLFFPGAKKISYEEVIENLKEISESGLIPVEIRYTYA